MRFRSGLARGSDRDACLAGNRKESAARRHDRLGAGDRIMTGLQSLPVLGASLAGPIVEQEVGSVLSGSAGSFPGPASRTLRRPERRSGCLTSPLIGHRPCQSQPRRQAFRRPGIGRCEPCATRRPCGRGRLRLTFLQARSPDASRDDGRAGPCVFGAVLRGGGGGKFGAADPGSGLGLLAPHPRRNERFRRHEIEARKRHRLVHDDGAVGRARACAERQQQAARHDHHAHPARSDHRLEESSTC